MKQIEIYTDGACRGNPGPGGWAALLRFGKHEKVLSGAEEHTTNNRMELMGPIVALQSVQEKCRIDLYTDSQYVQKGISIWLHKWKQNGWRKSDKQAVKNADLWQVLDEVAHKHDIVWHWVKGHSGHPENERVDQLANDAIDKMLSENNG